MKKISEDFYLEEFIYSRVAVDHGIDNTPPPAVTKRICLLTDSLLQPLRTLYGRSMTVTSGYRCAQVNRLVRGSENSQHLKGEAADIYVTDPQNLRDILLKNNDLIYDQAIWYPKRNFFHLSYTATGVNRRQYLER